MRNTVGSGEIWPGKSALAVKADRLNPGPSYGGGAEDGIAVSGTVLGIDIGAAGALALVNDAGQFLGVEEMPILRDGPNSRASVDIPLAAIAKWWGPRKAFIELWGVRLGEGPDGGLCVRTIVGVRRGRKDG